MTAISPTNPQPARPNRRLRRGRIFLAIYLVLFFLIVFTGCADRLILYPSTQGIPLPGLTRVEAEVPNAKPIEIWTGRSPAIKRGAEPEAYCLEFVGNASRG